MIIIKTKKDIGKPIHTPSDDLKQINATQLEYLAIGDFELIYDIDGHNSSEYNLAQNIILNKLMKLQEMKVIEETVEIDQKVEYYQDESTKKPNVLPIY